MSMIRFRSSNLNFFINEYRLYSDSSRRLVSSTALKTVTSTKSKPSADSRKPKSPFPPTYSEYSPATYNTEDSEFKNLKTDDIFGESEFMYRRSGYGSDVAAQGIDWMTSFEGIGCESVSDQAKKILMAPVNEDDIEIKPDGLIYLPEIKYRRILNQAFGPGGWGIVPRSPHSIIGRTLTREYALVVGSRLVSQSRGEQEFFSDDGLPTATEGVKSNSLMRCCKDLGIASELWDPLFIRKWKELNAVSVWVQDIKSKQKRKVWRRKGEKVGYPYQEIE